MESLVLFVVFFVAPHEDIIHGKRNSVSSLLRQMRQKVMGKTIMYKATCRFKISSISTAEKTLACFLAFADSGKSIRLDHPAANFPQCRTRSGRTGPYVHTLSKSKSHLFTVRSGSGHDHRLRVVMIDHSLAAQRGMSMRLCPILCDPPFNTLVTCI